MAASPLPRLDPDSAYMARLSLAGGQLLAMAADNPTGAADIVDKACLCGAGFRPEGHGRPDEQAVRARSVKPKECPTRLRASPYRRPFESLSGDGSRLLSRTRRVSSRVPLSRVLAGYPASLPVLPKSSERPGLSSGRPGSLRLAMFSTAGPKPCSFSRMPIDRQSSSATSAAVLPPCGASAWDPWSIGHRSMPHRRI